MKTILCLIPLMGAALLATAAEPVTNKPPTTTTTTTTELSATKDATPPPQPATPSEADRLSTQKIGERIATSGALTKTEPSKVRMLGELVNPFAPVQPQPETRWLERAPWSTAATTAAGSMTPVEMRHESRFGLTIAVR